jgi:hypothetical protein
MAKSVLKQLESLEDQKAKLLGEAKDEILDRIHEDLNALEEFGFKYKLVQVKKRRNQKAAPRKAAKSKRRRVSNAPCPICGFSTDRPHDARTHRWQEPKAPFTKAELKERGLRRI